MADREFATVFPPNTLAGNIGAPGPVPIMATDECTILQILRGEAATARNRAAALDRWLNEQRAGVAAAGLAVFDWPSDAAPERSSRIRFNLTSSAGFGIARITDENMLARGRRVYDLEAEFCSVGDTSSTVSLAADDPARLPAAFRSGSANLVLPFGDHGLMRASARPEKALIEAIPLGRMNPVPFYRILDAGAGGPVAPGFTPTITTADRCFGAWFQAGGTALGNMPGSRGWVAPADGNGFTGGLLTGTGCQLRFAYMSAHSAGTVADTGNVNNATRTYAGAYRGGTIGAMWGYEGLHGVGTTHAFPQFTGLPAAAKVVGVTLRNTTTAMIPAGAIEVRNNPGAAWSSAYWESPQGLSSWEPPALTDQANVAWINAAFVMVSS